MSIQRVTSVERFKALTRDLQQEIRQGAIDEMQASADDLVEQIRNSAPRGPTGNLKKSVRKGPGKTATSVKVMAGGPLTTVGFRRGASYQRNVVIGSGDTRGIAKGGEGGVVYDYALGVEFGTNDTKAHPFFWPSWRLRRKKIRSTLKRRVTKSIKQRSA